MVEKYEIIMTREELTYPFYETNVDLDKLKQDLLSAGPFLAEYPPRISVSIDDYSLLPYGDKSTIRKLEGLVSYKKESCCLVFKDIRFDKLGNIISEVELAGLNKDKFLENKQYGNVVYVPRFYFDPSMSLRIKTWDVDIV